MSNFLPYQKTPIQEIFHQDIERAGVRLLVKREDLNHSNVSGNKWWKLKYNFLEAEEKNYKKVLTFGGAFSNHIYSTAAAAAKLGFQSVGVIRGEETQPLNATLSFAQDSGMSLRYISRELYRKKHEPGFQDEMKIRFKDFFIIPEGGTNLLAIKGCEEFAQGLSDIQYDYIFLPVGTGGTLCGIIKGLNGMKEIFGIPVLKNGDFLFPVIQKWLIEYSGSIFNNWKLLTEYHHGGYAKTSPELASFIKTMLSDHHLPLDHVYTGKLLYAIFEEIRKKSFKRGSTLLAIHTGGLQGSSRVLNQH